MKILLSLLGILVALVSFAQEPPTAEEYYVVDVELQTTDDLLLLLDRAEQLLIEGVELPRGDAKVTLVLHGPVLTSLLTENYLQNKKLVDQVASLSAMEVIDVKACSTWMTMNGVDSKNLQPFVETVAYGPAEVKRLVEDKHYLYF